jgi:histone acetyltransferase MYST1
VLCSRRSRSQASAHATPLGGGDDDAEEDSVGFSPQPDLPSVPPTRIRNVQTVVLGQFEVDAWYFSPYPVAPPREVLPRLHVCPQCFKYFRSAAVYAEHIGKCPLTSPPGDAVYSDGLVQLWEVDGRQQKVYAQCLCLLAKLFLDHKSLYFDTDLFLFYPLTIHTAAGVITVGFFSKEKVGDNSLACICTLPHFQRCGFGRLLIEASYLLASREGRVSGPERPLSDLGRLSFHAYWTATALRCIAAAEARPSSSPRAPPLSLQDISAATSIHSDDLAEALQPLGLIEQKRGRARLACDPSELHALVQARSASARTSGSPRAPLPAGTAQLPPELRQRLLEHRLDVGKLRWIPFPEMVRKAGVK